MAHALAEIDWVALSALFFVDNNPSLGEDVLSCLGACEFVDIKMVTWRIYPVSPHRG